MAITSISTDWGSSPRNPRLTTSDSLAAITTAGYFATQQVAVDLLNHGAWEWLDGDFIEIVYSGGQGFFTYNASTDAFVSAAPSYVVKFAGKQANGGGSATIAITQAGVLSTDIVFAQVEASTNAVTINKVTPTANTITVLLSGNPGASTIIAWQALRASA